VTIATRVPPSSIANTRLAAKRVSEVAQVGRDVVTRHVHVVERAERGVVHQRTIRPRPRPPDQRVSRLGGRSASATNDASATPVRIGTAAFAARGGSTHSNIGTGSPSFAWKRPERTVAAAHDERHTLRAEQHD